MIAGTSSLKYAGHENERLNRGKGSHVNYIGAAGAGNDFKLPFL